MKWSLPLFAMMLVALPAFASNPCPPTLCGVGSEVAPLRSVSNQRFVEGALLRANSAESRSEWLPAIYWYQQVAARSPLYADLARLRVVQLQLKGGIGVHAETLELVRQGPPYPGRDLLVVEGQLGSGRVEEAALSTALSGPDRELTCELLAQKPALIATNLDAYYGSCSRVDFSDWSHPAHKASAKARLIRAERLYYDVRFNGAIAELEAIKTADLTSADACNYWFVRGRTLYRLRKRRSESPQAYQKVVDQCAQEKGLHRRSLYALGKRMFDTGKLAKSKGYFQAIVKHHADTSHVDDAWLYLARIARQEGRRADELEAVDTVLSNHPDGDMLFEIVWESHEALYRADQYKEFVEAIGKLSLPESDNQYFSQGRLEYFLGQSHTALKDPNAAARFWQQAWERYPFSFYGYLSHERLKKMGVTPTPLNPLVGSPKWMLDPKRSNSALAGALRLGLYKLAAEASVELGDDEEDQWWRALALHLDEHYEVSHNIVRRKILGRPWSPKNPGDMAWIGVISNWGLAWPDPYSKVVSDAVQAEAAQFGSEIVIPALPKSIIREESSFIVDIESYAGALGLMQLMPRTALGHDSDIKGAATPDRLRTAKINVRVGVDHLYWLAKRFDGHPALMVAAYNAGAGAVGKWIKRQPNQDIALFIEDIPPLQTRDYTKRVIGSYVAYQWLNGRTDFDPRVLKPAQ